MRGTYRRRPMKHSGYDRRCRRCRRCRHRCIAIEDSDSEVNSPSKISSIRKFRESDAWLWIEVSAIAVGLFFFIPTAISIQIDLEDRKAQRVAQAWALATRNSPGNAGKKPALEFLVNQGIPLVGIDMSSDKNGGSTFLHGVKLHSADLSNSKFNGALLGSAEFVGAKLDFSDFSGVNMIDARLTDSSLLHVNLSGSTLLNSDFSGAVLRGVNFDRANLTDSVLDRADVTYATFKKTNLHGVDLRNVKGLGYVDFSLACADGETKLPVGVEIGFCDWPTIFSPD